jgi:predicted ArsR family transcriptional regulator
MSWRDGLSARERVTRVIRSVTTPKTVNWVAQEADVHWNTAESHLDDLADEGSVRRVRNGEQTTYVPDFTKQYVEEIRRLALEHTAAQLRDELVAATERIGEIRDQYGVETHEELQQSLADPETSPAETRDRRRALREWEQQRDALTLVEHALSLQEDLRAVDPYADVPGDDADENRPAPGELA